LTGESISLLDLKSELASRLLRPCILCERRCGVDRTNGEIGFCGLADGVQVSAYSMLYNEGPLVGAPTFSVFVRGCALRCAFCYRPDELRAKGREELPALELAAILDRATERGARSWHFLGGNPDESLPAILRSLTLTTTSLPIVWNSALMLIPEAIELLKGIVDIWLPDFKFGNDACARQTAQIDNYVATIKRNLMALRGQEHVVVRHMMMTGHLDCCTNFVTEFLRCNLPNFSVHKFPCYMPKDSNRKKG
jgi:putative pyruvate formate lyase activating enzyme